MVGGFTPYACYLISALLTLESLDVPEENPKGGLTAPLEAVAPGPLSTEIM